MALKRRFRVLRGFVSLLTALSIAIVVGLGVYVTNACKLRAIKGERTFYLDSDTSQGLRKSELQLRDYARITGESVCFAVAADVSADKLAEEIAGRYGAEILFTESAAGVAAFYCYTTAWDSGIVVNGQRVNLHIAVGGALCTVGTPIIFGGF